jgi:hypothetical protein
LTFCGTRKKEWLPGNNYFKYSKVFENFMRMLVGEPTLKVDDSIANESLTIYDALEAFYTHKVLFI